jgi:hypothetical protein
VRYRGWAGIGVRWSGGVVHDAGRDLSGMMAHLLSEGIFFLF